MGNQNKSGPTGREYGAHGPQGLMPHGASRARNPRRQQLEGVPLAELRAVQAAHENVMARKKHGQRPPMIIDIRKMVLEGPGDGRLHTIQMNVELILSAPPDGINDERNILAGNRPAG